MEGVLAQQSSLCVSCRRRGEQAAGGSKLTRSFAPSRPYISLYWSAYESLKTHFIPSYSAYGPASATTSDSPHILRYTLCSVTACSLAASVTNPVELVQSRWQTSAGKRGVSVGGIVRELWRQGGVRAFGRGLGVRIAYAVS